MTVGQVIDNLAAIKVITNLADKDNGESQITDPGLITKLVFIRNKVVQIVELYESQVRGIRRKNRAAARAAKKANDSMEIEFINDDIEEDIMTNVKKENVHESYNMDSIENITYDEIKGLKLTPAVLSGLMGFGKLDGFK